MTYDTVKAATLDVNIPETLVGDVYTNPYRAIYGYHLAPTEDHYETITVTEKLKSEATYYVSMWCYDLLRQVDRID
jgi:hypothetical protein